MKTILTTNVLNDISAAMNLLENEFANHTITLLKSNAITNKFDDDANLTTEIHLKCLLSPRTNVDESNTIYNDDIGGAVKQQITVYIFKREALAKGIYTNDNKLLINTNDHFRLNDDLYYINQKSPIGFFEVTGELIKLRITQKVE